MKLIATADEMMKVATNSYIRGQHDICEAIVEAMDAAQKRGIIPAELAACFSELIEALRKTLPPRPQSPLE